MNCPVVIIKDIIILRRRARVKLEKTGFRIYIFCILHLFIHQVYSSCSIDRCIIIAFDLIGFSRKCRNLYHAIENTANQNTESCYIMDVNKDT